LAATGQGYLGRGDGRVDIADGRGIRVDFVFPSAPCP
jgi:hypothetical protein